MESLLEASARAQRSPVWTAIQGPCLERKLSDPRKEDQDGISIHNGAFLTTHWLFSPSMGGNLYISSELVRKEVTRVSTIW